MTATTTTLTAIYNDVTCPECRRRLAELDNPTNARSAFEVGNVSRTELGHQFFHSESGRVAICSAARVKTV